MSRLKTRWFVLALFVTLLLAGCRCDNSVIPTFFGIADSPADGEITSLNPSFDWHGSESCEPDEYILHVEEDSGVSGPIHTNIAESALPYTYSGGGFLPGRSYTWTLTAINGATDTEPVVFGPDTEVGQFFTGPVCSGETLIAPDLYDPESAGWVEDDPYIFKWTYAGGCLPESYQIQYALDPGFTNISMTVNTTEPYDQKMLMTFLDCTTLFWRVRAYDGTSYGPWSAGRDFHYVLSGGCYQWHYLSDDFAWLNTRVYIDACDQTGFIAAWTPAPLHPGCMVDGMYIVGDGTTYSGTLKDVVIDLGAGPCPSTGLDQKIGNSNAKFGVLTPGTYCVTISRDQTADNYGPISMMDGIWTKPRVKQILVEETIDFGPGNHDYLKIFAWDEPERPFLTFPLNFTYACKFGPEDICGIYDFALKGDEIPILARDRNSDWKLTELNGTMCYIQLPDALIAEHLAKYDLESANFDDLGYFVPPEPCDDSGSESGCAVHKDRESCSNAGCIWHVNNNSRLGGYCASQ